MRILLGISILVLVAILWTMISIVRHIRLTRRRNHFLRDQQQQEQLRSLSSVPAVSAARAVTNIQPLPARFAVPVIPISPAVEAAIPTPAIQKDASDSAATAPILLDASTPVSEPEISVEAQSPQTPAFPLQTATESFAHTQSAPCRRAEPAGVSGARRAITESETAAPSPLSLIAAARNLSQRRPAQPELRPAAPAKPSPRPDDYPLRILEFVPDPATNDVYPSSPIFPSLAAETAPTPINLRQMRQAIAPPEQATAPPADDPNVRRPVRGVQPPASTPARPAHRADWIHFNKDMGDLSDPTPSRIRDRLRTRSR